jgi:isopenicillin-N epimerase
MTELSSLFLLDPDVHFLNHGSFGATPRPVFAAYQEWQRRLERQPVRFIVHELEEHLAAARETLGRYLNAPGEDLVYVPNATFAVNVVARSLDLNPGDEILGSDHEYGACDNVWSLICAKTGAVYRRRPIDLPLTTPAEVVEAFWRGVTPRTKLIFLSHITSPTAITLPVAAICARARRAGILTLIDGAHAPGQIPLDLAAIGADFYAGNAHKWMMAPKGAAFLYARPQRQALLEPLVVSWGYGGAEGFSFGSTFLDYLQWWGTLDPAAYLATPDAIRFQAAHEWEAVRRRCRELLETAVSQITSLTGLPGVYSPAMPFAQMAVAPLPPLADAAAFQRTLYERFQVEVPLTRWRDRDFIRISVQGYNDEADLAQLMAGMAALL